MIEPLIALRQELHRHPELSGHESLTAHRIKTFISAHCPEMKIIEHIGGCGLAAIYYFSDVGPKLMIRCELDALPIQEYDDLEYASLVPGLSHKCGHDGHMAIVAGLALWLKRQKFNKGEVILLFQPAEETGKGVVAVIHDPAYARIKPDYLFALHNIPGVHMNSIVIVPGQFSATVQSFCITLTGRESHASEPEKGINPSHALAEIIQSLQSMMVQNVQDPSFALLTPVFLNMGQKSYGISPASAELHYTIRTWSEASMSTLCDLIKASVTSICKKYHLKHNINWFEEFPSGQNNEYCNSIIEEVAHQLGLEVIVRDHPFKFGEDFGNFTRITNGAMFGLGAGIGTPPLHDASYDFPDKLILTGVQMFSGIIKKLLTASTES